jgi:hypothetical protein
MRSLQDSTRQFKLDPFSQRLFLGRGPALLVWKFSKKPDFSKSYSPSKEIRRRSSKLLASLGQIKEVRAKVYSLE